VVSTKIYGEAQERFLFTPTGGAQTVALATKKILAGYGALYNAYIIDTVSGSIYSPGTGEISVILQPDASALVSAAKASAYQSGDSQISLGIPAGLLTGGNVHVVVVTYLTLN
jgi:hypothetical protein